jgi:hypothetical protein
METISSRGRGVVRSRFGAAIRAKIRTDGREAVRAELGVSDGAVRAWESGTNPSYSACLRYGAILALDPRTGEAVPS